MTSRANTLLLKISRIDPTLVLATIFIIAVLRLIFVFFYTDIIPLNVHKHYIAFISSRNHTKALKSFIESDQVAFKKFYQFSLADVPNLPSINGLSRTNPCRRGDDCLIFLGKTTVNLIYYKVPVTFGATRKIYFRQSFDHGKSWTEEEFFGTGRVVVNGGQSGDDLWILDNDQAKLFVRSENGGPWQEKFLTQSDSQIYGANYNNVALLSNFNRFFGTKYTVRTDFQKNPFILPPPNWTNPPDDAFAYHLNENQELMFWVDSRLRQMKDVVYNSGGSEGWPFYETILDDAYTLFVAKSEDGGKTWSKPYRAKNFNGYELVNVFINSDQNNARIIYKTKVGNWNLPNIPTDYVVGEVPLSFFP